MIKRLFSFFKETEISDYRLQNINRKLQKYLIRLLKKNEKTDLVSTIKFTLSFKCT